MLISQVLHSFINTIYITPTTIYLKSKVTKNLFNLQEWHQNTQNCKSLFQQIFVSKTFTVGTKTKNLSRTTRFGLWSSYTGLTVIYTSELCRHKKYFVVMHSDLSSVHLKVLSATFLLVCFMSKRQHLQNKEKYFLFHFKSSFCSCDNQILIIHIFKCHDVIKCLGMKHKTYIDEQLGK